MNKDSERARRWQLANPERHKANQLRWYEKMKERRRGNFALLYPQGRLVKMERVKLARRQRKVELIAHMGGKCADCGGSFHPSAMDFHHKDPSTKDINLVTFTGVSRARALAELAKCVLLCSNCHRIRHALEEEAKAAAGMTADDYERVPTVVGA